eukprot:Nk52_evm13s2622 gene=Nk52_evmTU13s2622
MSQFNPNNFNFNNPLQQDPNGNLGGSFGRPSPISPQQVQNNNQRGYPNSLQRHQQLQPGRAGNIPVGLPGLGGYYDQQGAFDGVGGGSGTGGNHPQSSTSYGEHHDNTTAGLHSLYFNNGMGGAGATNGPPSHAGMMGQPVMRPMGGVGAGGRQGAEGTHEQYGLSTLMDGGGGGRDDGGDAGGGGQEFGGFNQAPPIMMMNPNTFEMMPGYPDHYQQQQSMMWMNQQLLQRQQYQQQLQQQQQQQQQQMALGTSMGSPRKRSGASVGGLASPGHRKGSSGSVSNSKSVNADDVLMPQAGSENVPTGKKKRGRKPLNPTSAGGTGGVKDSNEKRTEGGVEPSGDQSDGEIGASTFSFDIMDRINQISKDVKASNIGRAKKSKKNTLKKVQKITTKKTNVKKVVANKEVKGAKKKGKEKQSQENCFMCGLPAQANSNQCGDCKKKLKGIFKHVPSPVDDEGNSLRKENSTETVSKPKTGKKRGRKPKIAAESIKGDSEQGKVMQEKPAKRRGPGRPPGQGKAKKAPKKATESVIRTSSIEVAGGAEPGGTGSLLKKKRADGDNKKGKIVCACCGISFLPRNIGKLEITCSNRCNEAFIFGEKLKPLPQEKDGQEVNGGSGGGAGMLVNETSNIGNAVFNINEDATPRYTEKGGVIDGKRLQVVDMKKEKEKADRRDSSLQRTSSDELRTTEPAPILDVKLESELKPINAPVDVEVEACTDPKLLQYENKDGYALTFLQRYFRYIEEKCTAENTHFEIPKLNEDTYVDIFCLHKLISFSKNDWESIQLFLKAHDSPLEPNEETRALLVTMYEKLCLGDFILSDACPEEMQPSFAEDEKGSRTLKIMGPPKYQHMSGVKNMARFANNEVNYHKVGMSLRSGFANDTEAETVSALLTMVDGSDEIGDEEFARLYTVGEIGPQLLGAMCKVKCGYEIPRVYKTYFGVEKEGELSSSSGTSSTSEDTEEFNHSNVEKATMICLWLLKCLHGSASNRQVVTDSAFFWHSLCCLLTCDRESDLFEYGVDLVLVLVNNVALDLSIVSKYGEGIKECILETFMGFWYYTEEYGDDSHCVDFLRFFKSLMLIEENVWVLRNLSEQNSNLRNLNEKVLFVVEKDKRLVKMGLQTLGSMAIRNANMTRKSSNDVVERFICKVIENCDGESDERTQLLACSIYLQFLVFTKDLKFLAEFIPKLIEIQMEAKTRQDSRELKVARERILVEYFKRVDFEKSKRNYTPFASAQKQ